MDPFALVLFGGLFVFVAGVFLLGRLYPGSGLEQLGMRSAREITETREALEAEDLEQMVAARNARRRARGEREVSALEVELSVTRENSQELARRRSELADQDVRELLELTNARRRARGLPERTRADYDPARGTEAEREGRPPIEPA